MFLGGHCILGVAFNDCLFRPSFPRGDLSLRFFNATKATPSIPYRILNVYRDIRVCLIAIARYIVSVVIVLHFDICVYHQAHLGRQFKLCLFVSSRVFEGED